MFIKTNESLYKFWQNCRKQYYIIIKPSGEHGDIIFLDTPMYNENIYLVTFASLHPEQLFSSSKHSSFLPGKEKRAARSFWSCQQEREPEPAFQSRLCLSPPR